MLAPVEGHGPFEVANGGEEVGRFRPPGGGRRPPLASHSAGLKQYTPLAPVAVVEQPCSIRLGSRRARHLQRATQGEGAGSAGKVLCK